MALVRLFQIPVFLSAFITGAVFIAPASSAQASGGWSVCNETSMIVETATGRPNDTDVIVEGWTRIRPGECATVISGPLKPGPYYLYGRSSRAHRGGTKSWTGDYELCVDSQGSFSVESPPDCVAMGLEPRKFQPVLIESKTRWTTTLKETQIWKDDTAKAAGIQRLLDDAGVESGSMDGYIGRRTRRAIADFLESKQLSAESTDEQLIDYLEQVAIERARNLGLTLCNRTENRLWTAIARRRGEGWESRGWWAFEAGGCERVIDDALIGASHFVYAEMETDGGTKVLKDTFDTFCISHAQFAIIGRDKCGQAFYETAAFKETDVPEKGRLVVEFFDRDFRYAEEIEAK